MYGVGDQDETSIHHVPLVPRLVVDIIGYEAGFRNANCRKHGLLPEAASAFDSSDSVHNAQCQNALHWAGDNAEGQSLGIVLVPSLDVKSECSWKEPISKKVQAWPGGQFIQPNSVKTVFQLCPKFTAAANNKTSNTVLQASTP